MFSIDDFNSILPRKKLDEIAENQAEAYQSADPFPHAVFDGLFCPEFLRKVASEFPEKTSDCWRQFDNNREKKLASIGDQQLGPYARALIANLNSGTFVDFLVKLTGIEGLIADPYLEGGGMHRIEPGGKLSVHVDFNKHRRMNLDRRINVLIYLNENWEESYGGHFELWNRDVTHPVVKVLPVFNRMAMFSTTEISWHGHPTPMSCPPDRNRRSIALYYYSAGRDDGYENTEEHSTIFKERPGESLFGDLPSAFAEKLKRTARQIIPRPLVVLIKRAMGKQ
ncbi:MAG: 2OG-Fe(II) oxygenase [Planctomycetota bacterium]